MFYLSTNPLPLCLDFLISKFPNVLFVHQPSATCSVPRFLDFRNFLDFQISNILFVHQPTVLILVSQLSILPYQHLFWSPDIGGKCGYEIEDRSILVNCPTDDPCFVIWISFFTFVIFFFYKFNILANVMMRTPIRLKLLDLFGENDQRDHRLRRSRREAGIFLSMSIRGLRRPFWGVSADRLLAICNVQYIRQIYRMSIFWAPFNFANESENF